MSRHKKGNKQGCEGSRRNGKKPAAKVPIVRERSARDSEGKSSYVPPSFELTDDLKGEAKLRETIEKELPRLVEALATEEIDVIALHQDAFASGYDAKEYMLLGMAIKYAGLHGVAVQIIGTNLETC